MSEYITIKVNNDLYQKIKDTYLPFGKEVNLNYTDYISKIGELEITGYNSLKTYHKVTFKGAGASNEASKWVDELPKIKRKRTIPTKWVDLNEQIGSDEVGVGDFLLPIVVVAAYIKRSQINRLKELGIDDSKKMNDEKILEVGPIVIKEFSYSSLTCPNSKYNEMTSKGENLNSLKAKLHNRALSNLYKKHPDIPHIYVDEFCSKDNYYSYLDERDEPIVRNITFQTKGESYYPSVALASVIARYSFLLKRESLSKELGIDIPLGASSKVDETAKKILKKLGEEQFDKLVKKNFKNYKRVKEL